MVCLQKISNALTVEERLQTAAIRINTQPWKATATVRSARIARLAVVSAKCSHGEAVAAVAQRKAVQISREGQPDGLWASETGNHRDPNRRI
jgi:hypothetical protein